MQKIAFAKCSLALGAGDVDVRPACGGTNAEFSHTLRFDAPQAARTNRSSGNPASRDSAPWLA